MKKLFTLTLLALIFHTAVAQTGCSSRYEGMTGAKRSASVADIAKMNAYDVHYYKLDLDLRNYSTYLGGSATMKATALQPITEITLQLHPSLTIDSILLNGVKTTFTRASDVLTIAAPGIMNTGASFSVQTFYYGTPPAPGKGAIGDGFSNNSASKVTWSLSEPYSAYEWWPCKQVLQDKADSSEVWVTTDSINKAGSNGLLRNITNIGNGRVRYEWKSGYPIAYYLISVAVCPYKESIAYAHPAGADSILIQNYLFKNATPDVIEAIQYTPVLIETFSKKYGLYPFAGEKYGHCQAVLGGAMEHQTMTTIGAFNFEIVAHELAHHWFGDLVTCAGWSDIWLNEGFASYSELVAIEALQSAAAAKEWISNTMQIAKYGSTVFVTDSLNSGRIFERASTYEKGAILLRMLRYEINNDTLFFQGLRNYLKAHSYRNAFLSDFRSIMEQTTGKNFSAFFDQWYYKEGYPVLSGQWDQSMAGTVKLLIKQTASTGTTVFVTPVDVTFYYDGGDTTIRVPLDADNKWYTLNLPGKNIYSVHIDRDDYILNDLISIARNPALGLGEQPEFANIILFPNPAIDRLTITGAAGSLLKISDMTGKEIAVYNISASEEILDVAVLPPGIYLIQINRNGITGYSKLIKN